MSHVCVDRAARSGSADSTRFQNGLKPLCSNLRTTRRASSSESSTINTRSGLPIWLSIASGGSAAVDTADTREPRDHR